MVRTKNFLLSKKTTFLSPISLVSNEYSDKKETLAASVNNRLQRSGSMLCGSVLLQREMMIMQKRKHICLPSMTTTDFRRSKKPVSTKPSCLSFQLPLATVTHNKSRASFLEQGSKRVMTVINLGSRKRMRFGKPRSAQGTWKRSRLIADKYCTLWG